MNILEAKAEVEVSALTQAESWLGCAASIEDGLTEEYLWGWIFVFVAKNPAESKLRYPSIRFLYHRPTGIVSHIGPIGTRIRSTLESLGIYTGIDDEYPLSYDDGIES